jgi:hypothetical protein
MILNAESNSYSNFFSFGGSNNNIKDDSIQVLIEAPDFNSRRISASVVVDADINSIWNIITDYNNLAEHVPNLVVSQTVGNRDGNNVRLFQEGAQKIIGFDFRASLTMDMNEEIEDENRAMKERRLNFKLIESGMFSSFDGSWTARYHSRSKVLDPVLNRYVYKYKAILSYSVFVRPRGPVPVLALEWRIREDIPINLKAVKEASEIYYLKNGIQKNQVDNKEEYYAVKSQAPEWANDETLGSYLRNIKSSKKNNDIKDIKKMNLY